MVSNLQNHTITAFYESRHDAEAAAAKLRQSGVPAGDVIVSPDNARDEVLYADAAPTRTKTGFWASLEDMFGGTEDHHVYAEGVRRGHVMLTASVADAQLDGAIAILEENGSIDLDQHEETWRSEGWTGGAPAGIETAEVVGGATGLAMADDSTTRRVATSSTPVGAKPVAGLGRAAEDVLQVVEERLEVGKRAVSRGKVRLHSYVVENQASEDVRLRDETVTVDRRVVDRPVAALGADAFGERTIEMEEIDEEAVVAKTARVVEEIGIRKDVTDRVETVRDTVRSTKVDIEDTRTLGTSATGSAAALGSRLVKDMEVVGSDGQHVGVIDRVEGAVMKLKRMDPASGGQHHLLPTELVRTISADGKALLDIAAADAMKRWTAA